MIPKSVVTLYNGEKIAYYKFGNGHQNLLLIHGNYSSSYQFLNLINKFSNYTCYVVDLRGYGDSSYYRRINSLEDFSKDLIDFLKKLEINMFSILATSLGGGVAMQLAADLNEQVHKLVLISSTTYKGYPLYKKNQAGETNYGETYKNADELFLDEVDVVPYLKMIKDKNLPGIKTFLTTNFYHQNFDDQELLDLMANEALKQRNLIDVDFALAKFNIGSKHNFYANGNNSISNIKCPILHIIGEDDILTPKYMALDNYYRLKDQSRIINYPYCGQMTFTYDEKLLQQINQFLEGD